VAQITPLLARDLEYLGRYRLTGRLGKGGQGVVFLGQTPGGPPVAVKTLHSEWAAEPRVKERFAKEIGAAKRVSPFCVAQVLDADPFGAPPYIVTEYIDGPTLQGSVQSEGARSGPALHRLAVATATALAAIHEADVVHRDFKPANVLLGVDGPRVIDFGIARTLDGTATLTGGVLGTPAYMAPEQFEGRAIGPAADVFAWGCVIAFAATASAPFGSESVAAITYRVLHGEPDLGSLTGPLRDIVVACLAKDAAARPSMREVLLWLLGRPGTAQTSLDEALAWQVAKRRSRPHPVRRTRPRTNPPTSRPAVTSPRTTPRPAVRVRAHAPRWSRSARSRRPRWSSRACCSGRTSAARDRGAREERSRPPRRRPQAPATSASPAAHGSAWSSGRATGRTRWRSPPTPRAARTS
jgi:serine/threonine protein kinase